MITLLSIWGWVRDNVLTVVLLVLGALLGYQKLRSDRLAEENEELEREVHTLEIKAEAGEVRSRPVPRDKSDILDRM